ncbi:LANO_0F05732g1_1 [Lachancea nothofagi CBS 11611]|uniref:LANO_0F05732g1_1 n=1 Tax=Lachancea nothofagi CBS 11611 TaxID=1266666 RepID=A0A1G4K859_9SACH|nr:LANO_0F05732g1_1 [Lachancea nothofagi CBS 11611]
MDAFVERISSSESLLENSIRLRDRSRNEPAVDFASVRRLSALCHGLRDKPYGPELDCVAVALANVLLKTPSFRAQVLVETPDILRDVQHRLFYDSRQPGFALSHEIPLWRVLFLLAHCQPPIQITSAGDIDLFDPQLAPTKFQSLVALLAASGSAPDPALEVVLEELGKYWYAVSYHYGSQAHNFDEVFWDSLQQLNVTLRNRSHQLLESYSGTLLQFCSILLLLPENKLTATFDMVLNLMLVLKQSVTQWLRKVSQELYSSLTDYKIPQILHVMHMFVLKSPTKVREQIAPCLRSLPGAEVDLKCYLLELHNSSISCSDTRDAINAILQEVNLHIQTPTSEYPQDITKIPRSQPLINSNNSTETFVDCEGVSSKVCAHANDSSTSITTACHSKSSANMDDSWTEEEQHIEAERIMAAIRRLDQLGIIKATLPSV